VIASGAPTAVTKVAPILERLGQRLFVVGDDAGTANLMKLAGNVVTALTPGHCDTRDRHRRADRQGRHSMMSSIRSFRQALAMAGIATPALGASLAAAPAANQTGNSIMTMKQDLADREKDIHWPEGFDPSRADLFSHNALLINASCERIWGHIVDGTKSPSFEIRKLWQPQSCNDDLQGCSVSE
jgi:hypothetical protein